MTDLGALAQTVDTLHARAVALLEQPPDSPQAWLNVSKMVFLAGEILQLYTVLAAMQDYLPLLDDVLTDLRERIAIAEARACGSLPAPGQYPGWDVPGGLDALNAWFTAYRPGVADDADSDLDLDVWGEL